MSLEQPFGRSNTEPDPLSEPAGECETCGTGLTVGSAKVITVTLGTGKKVAVTVCETCKRER